jgi:hypothetical protein
MPASNLGDARGASDTRGVWVQALTSGVLGVPAVEERSFTGVSSA